MPHHLSPGVEDSRDMLSKFRRKELESILSAEGFSAPIGIPAISAREMLRNAGIDGRRYVDDHGQFIQPEATGPSVDIDGMKMSELRQFCAQNGIPWQMTDKKVELQAKIREHLRG